MQAFPAHCPATTPGQPRGCSKDWAILEPLAGLITRCAALAAGLCRGHDYAEQLALLGRTGRSIQDGSLATPKGRAALGSEIDARIRGAADHRLSPRQLDFLRWLSRSVQEERLTTEEGRIALASRIVMRVQGWVEDLEDCG
jgi:hypothetical protein